jgi:two-component system, sensor histidine kinase and response regulator
MLEVSSPSLMSGSSAPKLLAHLLIVDDDPLQRLLLRRLLGADYTVTEAASGREAINLLADHAFDLMLLDVMLPGVSGLEVLQLTRESLSSSDLPVIVISALDSHSDIIHGLNLGANDYVAKPFHPDVIRARVRTQLELKRLADANKAAIAQLKATQQMQEKFMRIVAHDLKNPLNNMRTAHYLLQALLEGNNEGLQILEHADSTLNEMLSMISTFLEVAALQSPNHQVEVNVDCINVSDVILSQVDQYKLSAGQKNITIQTGSITGLVTADNRLLGQIIANLLSNAIKFSPPDTTISIFTELDDDMLCINISDQGPGIPHAERNQLFEMFTKLSPRPTGGEGSTGLGLWIVRQLVELQGGKIGAEFPPDGGSVFWVALPGYCR